MPPPVRATATGSARTGRFPDPASRLQPEGVHQASQVVDLRFPWTDGAWRGLLLEQFVFYELHVGTFTKEGTFDAVIPHLQELADLGVTAIEIMPVAQFPGTRNWGYDGVYPFAVQSSWGGPAGLQRLVDACHAHGLVAVLDVVYNHLGPEGNYLGQFGPYFTDRYRTPWGDAINFDGPHSDEVRTYFIENALQWVTDFHFDALRLDAVHAIPDPSAIPFLQELATAVHRRSEELGRPVWLIAESDLNDPRLIREPSRGGYGLDGQWSDDFHHALHTLLTGERQGYYEDFGTLEDLATAFRESFVYAGRYSQHRQRRYGAPTVDLPPSKFVVCSQNHDQVGNRMKGERLANLISFDGLKLAAAAVILSPSLPLLFMGEEYGETAPFLYFVDHADADLIEAVRNGRRSEFSAFRWQGEPSDPADPKTFEQSKLNHHLAHEGHHAVLRSWYRELLWLRQDHPALQSPTREGTTVNPAEESRVLTVRRTNGEASLLLVMNFDDAPATVTLKLEPQRLLLDSGAAEWSGSGGSQVEGARLRIAPWGVLLLEP